MLAAARSRFGEVGYDRATIRDIAAAAGVDPALVHYFFGTKERLFAAVMQLPVIPGDVLDTLLADGLPEPGRGLGEHVMRTVLGIWDVAAIRAPFLGLLRTAASDDQAAATLREFVTGNILSRIARLAGHGAGASGGGASGGGTSGGSAAGGGDAEFRAALVGSQVVGLGLARYVLQLEPLARASNEELAAAIGPAVERYLTGDLGPAAGRGPDGRPG
ncbi:MAG: TetR family transcriptional regulator [Actinobacteria bacterium]|nr:TetR family transcriptional regulator [Actinomycetota bacterium]MBO0786061.1 TetR family transcriptional regulator [Actinomycetota bacterium]